MTKIIQRTLKGGGNGAWGGVRMGRGEIEVRLRWGQVGRGEAK